MIHTTALYFSSSVCVETVRSSVCSLDLHVVVPIDHLGPVVRRKMNRSNGQRFFLTFQNCLFTAISLIKVQYF